MLKFKVIVRPNINTSLYKWVKNKGTTVFYPFSKRGIRSKVRELLDHPNNRISVNALKE